MVTNILNISSNADDKYKNGNYYGGNNGNPNTGITELAVGLALLQITFSISNSKYKKVQESIMTLFKETVDLVDAFYGYIAHSDTIERQHATGTIITRIPGMFWCNYFGRVYIKFFGEEKFNESQWYKIVLNNENGIFLFLDENPDGRLLTDKTIEEDYKKYLGYDSFANRQEEEIKKQNLVKWHNEDPVQYKKVPKLI